ATGLTCRCRGRPPGGPASEVRSSMIYEDSCGIVLDDVFLRLPGFLPGVEVLLKIEGLNPAGSIKLKTALSLVEDLEECARLRAGSRIIESSSGNLGRALS